ncbi:MAG: MFS transporter [Fimbriimonas sp.]
MFLPPGGGTSGPGHREQVATRVAFLVAGITMASWAPLVPVVKARLGLDEGQLGTLLLLLGLGSVIGMPLSGGFAARFGCRRVILVAGVLGCVALPLLAAAGNSSALAAGLLLFGAGLGTIDVVMNIQAVIVERASGRAMMSGFHGLYSVGGIVGAGGMTGLLALGTTPLVATVIVAISAVLILFAFRKGLLPYATDEESPAFALPRGRVLLIGALCFILFLAEGSVLDWSGVLLNVDRGLDKARSGLGYVAFATTMTIGRLMGDRIVGKLGPSRILVFGGLCAALGFALAALVPVWPVAILGFALVGVGASNVVPVLFSAAGRQKAMPENLAIAAVTTLGYGGILAGPALIGFLARASTLPLALLAVAVLLVVVASCARSATDEGIPNAL